MRDAVTRPPDEEELLAEQLRCAANRARLAAGLGVLAPDVRLAEAARQHAERMRNLAFFAHDDPYDGTSLPERLDGVRARGLLWAAENLALCDDRPERAVELWLESPEHCANLLNPQASLAGQAAMRGRDSTVYWVQVYGRHRLRWPRPWPG